MIAVQTALMRLYIHITHWCRVTHICVSQLAIIGSDNGLEPGRHQAIIWTNAGILLIEPVGTNFSEISIEIDTFSGDKIMWKCHLENGCHFSRPQCVNTCFNVCSYNIIIMCDLYIELEPQAACLLCPLTICLHARLLYWLHQ